MIFLLAGQQGERIITAILSLKISKTVQKLLFLLDVNLA